MRARLLPARRRPGRRPLPAQDPRGRSRRRASPPHTRARTARSGSSPPISTRSTTATARTASPRPPNIYFGVEDLAELTPAQAALLAGLPKAPSVYDPYRYADRGRGGPARRPGGLAAGRPARLRPARPRRRRALDAAHAGGARGGARRARDPRRRASHEDARAPLRLGRSGPSSTGCSAGGMPSRPGGYRVITTLDWNAQKLAEKYVYAATVIPHLPFNEARKEIEPPRSPSGRPCLGQQPPRTRTSTTARSSRSTTGPATSSPTSAAAATSERTSRASSSSRSTTRRRPSGSRARRSSRSSTRPRSTSASSRPGSLLLDISADFGGWTPKNADLLERGPVRARQALQLSLNLPAIRALERVGNEPAATVAEDLGVKFLNGHKAFLQSGLAGAIGTVETRPIDLTAAFGALGNGGVHVPTRMVLSIERPDGTAEYRAPETRTASEAISKQAAWLVIDILAGNTDMRQNRFWASHARAAQHEERRAPARRGQDRHRGQPTGLRDLRLPGAAEEPRRACPGGRRLDGQQRPLGAANVGRTPRRSPRPARSGTPSFATTPPDGRSPTSSAPKDIVQATDRPLVGREPGSLDAGHGLGAASSRAPSRAPRAQSTEPGLLYTQGCGGWMVDPVAGRARARALGRRRRRLGEPGAARHRRPRPVRLHHRVLVRGGLVGRPARRKVPRAGQGQREGQGQRKPPKPPKPDEPPPDDDSDGARDLLAGSTGSTGSTARRLHGRADPVPAVRRRASPALTPRSAPQSTTDTDLKRARNGRPAGPTVSPNQNECAAALDPTTCEPIARVPAE